MINKEEIKMTKLELQIIVETVRDIFNKKVKKEDEDIYKIDGRQFLAIEKALEYISELEKELEHYKNIVAGKSIQEMGVSNLYGGTEDDKSKM